MNTSMKCRSALLLSLFIFLGSTFCQAGQPASEKKKEVSKTFTVSGSDELAINNRYGNITITHGSNSEVAIRVVVEAKANTDNRAQEILDRVTIQLEKTGNIVSGTTTLKNQTTKGGNNENFSINYFVTMPASMTSSLEQSYGNISLPENNGGKTSIELKYGNLKAGNFTADLNLDAAYSNIDVKNLTNANMEIAYAGNASIDNANKLAIESKYSTLNMKDVKSLTLEAAYSKVKTGRMETVAMEMKYTDGDFAYIGQELAAELSYGNVTVKELSADFKSVGITARYGNINLNIPSKAAFTIDAENIKYGNVELNGFNTQVKKESNAVHTTVNNGSQKRISFDGGGYSNLKIKAL